jgi:sterol desaturase/sphingolipid hydroxylase (fatty acid hydroxylase superfamily)
MATLRNFAENQAMMIVAACWFLALAFAVKGRAALRYSREAIAQTRINLIFYVVDRVTVTPALGLVTAGLVTLISLAGLRLDTAALWRWMGPAPTLLAAVVVNDFFGYWRHRLQHTPGFWPVHAVHHGDTHLTWFSLERMHPVDRLLNAMDWVVLIALGFPVWAVAANTLARHWYAYLIHADVPWTLGPASWVLYSPAMHRWHHARDVEGSGANFATMFSVWDRLFGTYHQPGPCGVPLGVQEDLGCGALGQYLYPIRVVRDALKARQTGRGRSGKVGQDANLIPPGGAAAVVDRVSDARIYGRETRCIGGGSAGEKEVLERAG